MRLIWGVDLVLRKFAPVCFDRLYTPWTARRICSRYVSICCIYFYLSDSLTKKRELLGYFYVICSYVRRICSSLACEVISRSSLSFKNDFLKLVVPKLSIDCLASATIIVLFRLFLDCVGKSLWLLAPRSRTILGLWEESIVRKNLLCYSGLTNKVVDFDNNCRSVSMAEKCYRSSPRRLICEVDSDLIRPFTRAKVVSWPVSPRETALFSSILISWLII